MDELETNYWEVSLIYPRRRPSLYKYLPTTPKPRRPLPRMMTQFQAQNESDQPNYSYDEESNFEDDNEDDDADDDDDEIYSSKDNSDEVDYMNEPIDTESVRRYVDVAIHDRLTPPLKTTLQKPRIDVEISKCVKTNIKNNWNARNNKREPKYHFFCWTICAAILLLAFLTINDSKAENIKFLFEINQQQPSKQDIINDLENTIDEISRKFTKQYSNIWHEIIAGVADVVRDPNKPTIFFLFSNQDNTMSCLARMIANASKAALGSDGNGLWLSASNMGNDYGVVINKYGNEIEEQKIVIVENLLDIDPKAMLAFHHMCDRENPLVKKAIYIITMVTDGYKQNNEIPTKFVEDQLKLKMKNSIDADKLEPLITRMTDGPIIHVQPEPDILNCPIRY